MKENCYMCDEKKTVEWLSLWYDGKQREICSLECRSKLEELSKVNPKKTYSNSLTSRSS